MAPPHATPHAATLSFHGADQGVTGSCHLLEVNGTTILVDCGLYQGRRELIDENRAPFGFDPAAIDYLLLTHAHLDHCGRLPLLVKQGFRGEVIATSATRELAMLVLLDSAHLHEEEARRAQRRIERRGAAPEGPLYTIDEAVWSLNRFGRMVAYDETITLGNGVAVRFIDAGHILGSAAAVVDAGTAAGKRTIVFSGDLGGFGHPLLRDPSRPPPADYVVIESTYGDRLHRSLSASVEELWSAIRDTLQRGGNAIIPTFALERSQEILYYLREGVAQGRLPPNLPVFLDSPMAISATEIMRRHPECLDRARQEELARGDPFAFPGLRYLREAADSMALNRITSGAVIMAGSGMCTGGRVRHHLRHHLWRKQSSVIFVGYAAEGTLARRIIDGEREVELFGEEIQVRAHVHTINGFSAHADQAELLAWHAATGHPRTTFLVHGDPDRGLKVLGETLESKGLATATPALHDRVMLS